MHMELQRICGMLYGLARKDVEWNCSKIESIREGKGKKGNFPGK